jgi:hypothetical protein
MPTTTLAREIVDTDKIVVATLLAEGLGYSTRYFSHVLDCLTEHPTPAGFPKYGYLLEHDDAVVGAILLIFSTIPSASGGASIRCHVTSWYVKPGFRSFAALFFSKGLKHRNVTYLNISARPATLPIIRLQGFSQYSKGQFVAIPALRSTSPSGQVKVVEATSAPEVPNSFDKELVLAHSKYGCICLWCMTSTGAHPFIFQKRYFKGILPGVQLIYCRDMDDFVRFAQPIGLYLALRGKFAIRVDSNGPIPGLPGKFFDRMEPRYFKGPKPRLGDLAYTQPVIAGYQRRHWSHD